jgi:hypothetical protein
MYAGQRAGLTVSKPISQPTGHTLLANGHGGARVGIGSRSVPAARVLPNKFSAPESGRRVTVINRWVCLVFGLPLFMMGCDNMVFPVGGNRSSHPMKSRAKRSPAAVVPATIFHIALLSASLGPEMLPTVFVSSLILSHLGTPVYAECFRCL